MYNFIKRKFIKNDIQREKKLKIARTEAILRTRRKAYRPQAPMGFKARNTSAYYLSFHN